MAKILSTVTKSTVIKEEIHLLDFDVIVPAGKPATAGRAVAVFGKLRFVDGVLESNTQAPFSPLDVPVATLASRCQEFGLPEASVLINGFRDMFHALRDEAEAAAAAVDQSSSSSSSDE